MEFKDKKIIVIGAGLSGIAAARLLINAGARVIIRDSNDKITEDTIKDKLQKEWEIVKAHKIDREPDFEKLEFCLGGEEYAHIDSLDLIVVSPGVPLDGAFMKPYMESGIPVWGEVELAYSFEKGKVLAITGTNGKTTTTALLGHIMEDFLGKERVITVGNIGDPYTREVELTTAETVTVAEISSFMLETVHSFSPAVSAVLNITPDHLNRHHTMEAYAKAKGRIAQNLPDNGTLVLNLEDELCVKLGDALKDKALYFSSKRPVDEGIFYEAGVIYIVENGVKTLLIKEEEAAIVGLHNMENIMAAALMAIKAGVPVESLANSIKSFKAVEHRIEYVTVIDDVLYYNDSKGTNPDAAIKGIEAMKRPTVLIGGGYDKDSEYDDWMVACKGRVKSLILIGATKEKIRDCAIRHGIDNIFLEESFEDAMERSFLEAKPGDCVLLSPACASWGMFSNYEERGRIFKELVREREKMKGN